MSAMASRITSVYIIYSTICSGADQRKHQSFASLAFVRGIHRYQVNSQHKGPITQKMFPFDDVIMHGSTTNDLIFVIVSAETLIHFRICGNFTIDVIAKTAFGIDVNSQKDPNSEFVKNAKKINEFKLVNPALLLTRKFIAVPSHQRHSVSNHRWLFIDLFKLTSKKAPKPHVTGLGEENIGVRWIPSQRASSAHDSMKYGLPTHGDILLTT